MYKRKVWYLLVILAFSAATAFAQGGETARENPPETASVLKALSVPVSRALKQPITFSTDKVKVQGTWAFVSGQAKNANGGEPNWKLTRYQALIDSGDFEDNLFALLRKTNGKWRVVTYMMSCQDVCYLDWDKKYKAPSSLIQ